MAAPKARSAAALPSPPLPAVTQPQPESPELPPPASTLLLPLSALPLEPEEPPSTLAPESTALPPSLPPLEDPPASTLLPLSVPASTGGVLQVPCAEVVEEQTCPGVQPLPPVPRQPFRHFFVALSQTFPLVVVPHCASVAQLATQAPDGTSQKVRPPPRALQSASAAHFVQLPSALQKGAAAAHASPCSPLSTVHAVQLFAPLQTGLVAPAQET